MLTMDQIHHIRALYYEQGYNISEIAEVKIPARIAPLFQ